MRICSLGDVQVCAEIGLCQVSVFPQVSYSVVYDWSHLLPAIEKSFFQLNRLLYVL